MAMITALQISLALLCFEEHGLCREMVGLEQLLHCVQPETILVVVCFVAVKWVLFFSPGGL